MTIETKIKTHRRGGPLGWFLRHPKTTLSLLLFVLAGGSLAVVEAGATRRLNKRLDAIRAAGEPLTAEDLIAMIPPIPDEQNRAVAVLAPIREIYSAPISDEEKSKLPFVALGNIERPYRRWPQEVVEPARAYLSRFARQRAELRQALALKSGALRPKFPKPLIIETLVPELSEFRVVSKLLCLELRLHSEDSETDAVQARFGELLALDSVLNDSPILISGLVQIAIRSLALDLLEQAVNLNSLDASTIAEIQTAVADAERKFSLVNAMLGERASFHNFCTWAKGPAGGGVTLKRNGDWVEWLPALSQTDEALGLDIFENYIDAARQEPCPKALVKLREASRTHGTLPSYCLKSSILLAGNSRPIELWLRCIGLSRATQVALAAERYRIDRGSWPDNINALVPQYLTAVLKDPFDDQPIRYARIPEGIHVWTIGEDLTDNHGDIRRLARQREGKLKKDRAPDFGVMLLNPDLRRLPAETPGP